MRRADKLTIRPKTTDSISSGPNLEIYLNDQKLKGVTFLKIELKPRKVAKVVMEMVVELEADLPTEFKFKGIKEPRFKVGEDLYTLQELSTMGVITEVYPKKEIA